MRAQGIVMGMFLVALTVAATAAAAGDTSMPGTAAAGPQLAQSPRALKPGSDLTKATGGAKSGATIVLGAGSYPGVINVEGKTLTVKGDPGGKTVLTGAKSQMIVRVVKNGKLTLDHVTFKTRPKDGLAAYVNGGSATISDCHATGTMQPAFYADGGRIEVVRCTLTDLQDSGVAGVKKSTVVVRDSTISGSPKGGVVIRKDSKGEVSGSRFEKITGQIVTASENSSVVVSKSRFTASPGRGVVISRNSTGIVTASQFDTLGGIGVLGLEGSTVTVEKSTFADMKDTAIHGQKNGSLTVKSSRFTRVKSAVVTLEGAVDVTVQSNAISGVPAKHYAIATASDGKMVVSGNHIVDAAGGIQMSGKVKTPAVISHNLIVKTGGRGLSLQVSAAGKGPGIRVSGNRILGSGDAAVFLHGSPGAEFTDNVIVTKNAEAVFWQEKSSVRLEGNVIAGAKSALAAHGSAGAGSVIGSDIIIGAVDPKYAAKRNAAGARVAVLNDNTETQARFRAKADAVLAAVDATGTDLKPVEAAAAALGGEAKKLRAEGAKLSAIKLDIVDMLGKPFSNGYSVYDSAGKEVFSDPIANPVAIVRPGTYIVEPHFDASLARDVTVAAGESKTTAVQAKGTLVLKMSSPFGKGTIDLPLALKRRSDIARNLAAYREEFPLENIAVPRKGGTAEQRKTALTLARAALADLDPKILEASRAVAPLAKKAYKERTKEENEAFNKAFNAREALKWPFTLPGKILAAAGTADDARALVDAAGTADWLADRRMAIAAFIENRLGILDKGAVAAALKGTNRRLAQWAAIYMRYFGLDDGVGLLVKVLQNPEDAEITKRAAYALLGVPRTDVLAAMGTIVDLALTAQKGRKSDDRISAARKPAVLYLLAHGGAEDLKKVADFEMWESYADLLTLATTDPGELIGYMRNAKLPTDPKVVGHFIDRWSVDFAALCPMFRHLPARKRARMEREIEDAFVTLGMRFNLSGRTSNSDRLSSRSLHSADVSSCRATGSAARIVYEKNETFFRTRTWIPMPWAAEKPLKGKWYWNASRLDYMPHDELVKRLTAHHPTNDDGKRDMYLAYHAIATSVEMTIRDPLPGGADRRAFILINPSNPPGALAAVVAMRPAVVGDRLRVALSFDLAAHTESSLATMIDPPTRSFERYLAGRGKDIIGSVSLRRGDTVIPMTRAKDDGSGNFIFEAPLAEHGLANLNLDVALQVFETTWPLTFGLYAGDYGRTFNNATARLEAVRAAAEAKPGDARAVVAWGHALEATGRLDEARKRYETVLASNPGDVDLWFTVADMYTGRGLYDDAVTVLGKAVAALPTNADLQFELANALYRGGAYAKAAAAFGRLAAMEPKEIRWQWWRATNQFLAGDRKGAVAFFRGATTKYQHRRTVLLRYISAKMEGSPEDVAVAEADLKKVMTGQEKTLDGTIQGLVLGLVPAIKAFEAARSPAQQCLAHLYTGYTEILAKKTKEAKARFMSARETCSANQLEYRLAEAELGRLGGAQ